jgi:predicted transcriptional regulator
MRYIASEEAAIYQQLALKQAIFSHYLPRSFMQSPNFFIKSFTLVLSLVAQSLHMRHRSKTEILSRVLAVANSQGVTITKTLYKAFLSFNQAKAIIKTLTERGLLQFDRTTQTFKTTEKGHKIPQDYTELNELMKGLEKNEE